jgi:hypothetical protein
MAGVRFPEGSMYFSILHRVQTSPGVHPVKHTTAYEAFSRVGGLKRQERETGNSPAPFPKNILSCNFPSVGLNQNILKTLKTAVAFSPQANYTDGGAATCQGS